MYKQERFHTISDTADNDITISIAHWAKKNDSGMVWQQGHAERQEKHPNKWTNDEWANGKVDQLEGRAWSKEHNHITNQANATRFRHAGSIQVIPSNGSIAGRILKRLPEILTMERGMPALQKTTQMTDEAMRLIDDETTIQGVKMFGRQCIQ